MAADRDRPAGFSLRRWSQRKLEAARSSAAVPTPPAARPAVAAAAAPPAAQRAAGVPGAVAGPELPPLDSLGFDSDFTAFLQPKVDAALRRKALRTLFRDPRFNVMDGLDVYIDDYSKPDPIEPALVRELIQSRYIMDPPKARVNADGHVEDVPADERAAQAPPPAPAADAAPAGEAAAGAAPADAPGASDEPRREP
jgi:hypothetical protein